MSRDWLDEQHGHAFMSRDWLEQQHGHAFMPTPEYPDSQKMDMNYRE